MRETQKVECLRFAIAGLPPISGSVAPKLNQARLVRMQLQSELLQTVLPFAEKPLRFLPIFESHDDVIGIADDNNIAGSMMFRQCRTHRSKT